MTDGNEVGPLRRLNLNLVYPLDAILRAQTLTAAGLAIRLSQPAMSLALRKLRDHFDDELVIYGKTGRRLTALAEALAPRARSLLHTANALFSLDLDFDPATATRTITLAAPEPIETVLLSRVASRLLREGDGLSLRFASFDEPSSAALFAEGVDLAIVPESMLDPEFRHAPLFRQTSACLVAQDHPLIDTTISVDLYAKGRHAALSPQLETAVALYDMSDPLMHNRNVVVRTDRLASLPPLILDTDLIITVPNWLAQYLAHIYPLKLVSSPVIGSTMIYVQWEACRDKEPYIAWLRDHVLATSAWLNGLTD